MIERLVPSEYTRDAHFLVSPTLACLMLLVWFCTGLTAQNPGGANGSAAGSPMRVTHVLGLERIPNNANGNLSIQKDALQFQRDEGQAVQISIGSIQDVLLGEQEKQVRGLPMALGRT